MNEIRFRCRAQREFYCEMLAKSAVVDCYHRAFFYVMGLSEDTRAHVGDLFDFRTDCIRPSGLRSGWQTSGSIRICRLACNLWNGHASARNYRASTPYDLFCCEYAPWFMEGIRLRYPEYCQDLHHMKNAPDMAR